MGRRAEAFFSQARVVPFGGGRERAGEDGTRRGLRHDGGRVRRVEGGGEWRESCWNSGGERLFIPDRRSDWQMVRGPRGR